MKRVGLLGRRSFNKALLAMVATSCGSPGNGAGDARQDAGNEIDGASLQRRLLDLSRSGGGRLRLERGARIAIRNGLVIPPDVALDLNGGTIFATLFEANSAGVRVSSRSALSNGRVKVVSKGTPGVQAGAHAAVLVGALLGENPGIDDISPFEAPRDWSLRDLTLETDKSVPLEGIRLGAPGIQIMGGASRGLIENIIIPDSDTMQGGVMMDWGVVGAIQSSDVEGAARAFAVGRAYTTHPHDIRVANIRVGRLTRASVKETGSFGVRLSGCHDVTVRGLRVDHVSEAGFYHTLGDLGYEFARSPDRRRAGMGIRLSHAAIDSCISYAVRTDSFADNVGRAADAGYRPRHHVIEPVDMVIENVTARADRTAANTVGVRVDHQEGGTFRDLDLAGFATGVLVDAATTDITFADVEIAGSAEQAVLVGHKELPPSRIRLDRIRASGSGARSRLVNIERSRDVQMSSSGGVTVQRAPLAERAIIR